MKKLLVVLLTAVSLTACTWVQLTPEGEQVAIAAMDEMSACTKKGSTTVTTKADLASIDRNLEKVTTELETLARNSAVNLKGDTVVAAGDIEDGKQQYDVYLCNG